MTSLFICNCLVARCAGSQLAKATVCWGPAGWEAVMWQRCAGPRAAHRGRFHLPPTMAFAHVQAALCQTLTIINCVCKASVIINSSGPNGTLFAWWLSGGGGSWKLSFLFDFPENRDGVCVCENFCLKTQMSGWQGQKAAVIPLRVTTPDPPNAAGHPRGRAWAPAALLPHSGAGTAPPAGRGLPGAGGPAGAQEEGQARAGLQPLRREGPARCRPGGVSACAAPALKPRPRRTVVAEAGPARRLASPRLASPGPGRGRWRPGRAGRYDRHRALLRAAAGGAAPPGPPR